MAYDIGEKYLKEIDHVSLLESIDEVFDGATSLMTGNAVMYGSTVTALLSGLPIVGDLDIAVSNQEYKLLTTNFASSVKWVQIDGKTIQEKNPGANRFTGGPPTISSFDSEVASSSNPYKKAKHLPISDMVAFQTVNNARVQIIESRSMTGDLLEDALEVVRKVDFVFCGMAIDRYGRVLETIPNAYSDCLQRVIRIKDFQPRLEVKRLKSRFYKYIRRGWGLATSIDQAVLNLKRAQREHAIEMAKKGKKKPKHNPQSSVFRIKKTSSKGMVIESKPVLFQITENKKAIVDPIRHFARDSGVKLNSLTNGRGNIEFWASSSSIMMTPTLAKRIVVETTRYLTKKYGISSSLVRSLSSMDKKKTFKSSYGYGGIVKGKLEEKGYDSANTYATGYINTKSTTST